jgi:hypothetical protein
MIWWLHPRIEPVGSEQGRYNLDAPGLIEVLRRCVLTLVSSAAASETESWKSRAVLRIAR